MASEIFISHAVKDKELAEEVVELLQTGLNLDVSTIFCSSLPGLGIPAGVHFVNHIKGEIEAPKVVIALLTPNYFESQFCLSELGAAWARSHELLPLIVPPLAFKEVQGVLLGIQLSPVENASSLTQIRDQLIDILGIAAKNKGLSAHWESKRDKFLKKLPRLLKKLPTPKHVTAADHYKVLEDLKGAKQSISERDDKIEELQAMMAALTKAKDRKEVAAIKRAHLPESETLEQLEAKLKESLKPFHQCVAFVAYNELGLQRDYKVDGFNDRELADELQRAQSRNYITIDDSGYCVLSDNHPKIAEINKAFSALSRFLKSASEDLAEDFAETHEMPLDLRNRDYWEYSIDERIRRISA